MIDWTAEKADNLARALRQEPIILEALGYLKELGRPYGQPQEFAGQKTNTNSLVPAALSYNQQIGYFMFAGNFERLSVKEITPQELPMPFVHYGEKESESEPEKDDA